MVSAQEVYEDIVYLIEHVETMGDYEFKGIIFYKEKPPYKKVLYLLLNIAVLAFIIFVIMYL